MNDEQKILKLAKEKHMINVKSVKDLFKIHYITAERKIVDLELKGLLERQEMASPGSKRVFKFWRIKQV